MLIKSVQQKEGLLLLLVLLSSSTLWKISSAKVVVGAVLSKSFNSVLLSQPVNVTVEPNDQYESFAIVNDSAQGTIHGEFQLLEEDGTYSDLDIKKYLQSKEPIRLGDCTQAALFAITFNDTLMTELRERADIFSHNNIIILIIEVQFQYLGKLNEQSDIAYIHISLDNFSKTTSPDVIPTSTESANYSTENPAPCFGNSMKISRSLPLYRTFSLRLILFALCSCCFYVTIFE